MLIQIFSSWPLCSLSGLCGRTPRPQHWFIPEIVNYFIFKLLKINVVLSRSQPVDFQKVRLKVQPKNAPVRTPLQCCQAATFRAAPEPDQKLLQKTKIMTQKKFWIKMVSQSSLLPGLPDPPIFYISSSEPILAPAPSPTLKRVIFTLKQISLIVTGTGTF